MNEAVKFGVSSAILLVVSYCGSITVHLNQAVKPAIGFIYSVNQSALDSKTAFHQAGGVFRADEIDTVENLVCQPVEDTPPQSP